MSTGIITRFKDHLEDFKDLSGNDREFFLAGMSAMLLAIRPELGGNALMQVDIVARILVLSREGKTQEQILESLNGGMK